MLEKRRVHLEKRVAEADPNRTSFDQAEASALRWAVEKISELRRRLDELAALAEQVAPSAAERIRAIATERDNTAGG